MSSGDPNPYKSPDFKDLPVQSGGSTLSSSIIVQQRVVSCLMIVHGLLCCIVGGFLIVAAVVFPSMVAAQMQRQGGAQPPNMEMLLQVLYGTMGAAALIPGILQVIAGIQNFRLKNRVFGLVALGLGAFSVLTFYCAPTSIALLIYGLVIGLHDTTKRAYELAEEGKSYYDIHNLALNSPK